MRPGEVDFKDAPGRLHTEIFGKLTNTPWYGDAVYDRFSDAEYQRRFDATQEPLVARANSSSCSRNMSV
jgi:hypothetical protein